MSGSASFQRVRKSWSFQKLHGHERLPILFPEVIDRADVGVIQGRRGLRLAPEAGEGTRISGQVSRQKLERDETVETSILSFVDDSHPAAPELLHDAVMRDGLAGHGLGKHSERGMLGCDQSRVNRIVRSRGRSR